MKKLALTLAAAMTLASPVLADSVHNETAQKIFDQIKSENGAGATK